MGITRERFDAIKNAWGHVGSWAVWADAAPGAGVKSGIGDLSVLDPDTNPALLHTVTGDVVMLGINGSDAHGTRTFGNFHDPSPRANHFKLRFAYRGTPYWGAYLTDAFKNLPAYGAKRTIDYVRTHPDVARQQLGRLREELCALGSDDPLLIAFGRDLHALLIEQWGAEYRIVGVPHYAHFLSKENYRAQALEAIDRFRVRSARGE